MAKYLTTAKKAIGKIIKTEIGSMVCNSTNETLKKSFTYKSKKETLYTHQNAIIE